MSTHVNQTIRLSVSEAARLFGVDDRTIRRALKDGSLEYLLVRGRYKINFHSLIVWSQKNMRRQNKLAQRGIGQFVTEWKNN